MIDTYFDTNVFGHIYRRDDDVTDADVAKLEEAVASAKLRIFTSFPVIEETNAARLNALDETNGRLELIRTLTVQEQIVRHHSELVEADLHAYANNEDLPSKFEPSYPGLKNLYWDHTEKHYKELDKYAQDTMNRVAAFAKSMNDSFNNLIRPKANDIKKNKKQQSFPDYWAEMSEPWVEQLADKFGCLNECRARGINGLLDVQSIRLNTIAQTSLTYANTYERGAFERGNSRDMHHVVCASAVPTFVTHDKRLRKVLERMPTPGLEVLNLHELLGRL